MSLSAQNPQLLYKCVLCELIRCGGVALLILSCLGNCKGELVSSKSYLIVCLFLHIRKACCADVSYVIRGGGFSLLIELSC